MYTIRRTVAAAALVALFAVPAVAADPGVGADKIVVGQVAAFEGPAAALGLGMRTGLQAAFAEANKAGGVNGRKIELATADDGYEPNRSIEATRKMLDETKAFALVGPVGTPTSAATQPIASDGNVPFVGPFTGAEFLRTPFKPNVVNVRASYYQETEAMVERLTKDLKVERIAILYQDDAFGRAGLDGTNRALARRNMKLVSEGSFERNTTAVKAALLAIRKGDPQAVIMVGPYKPCAEFIKIARQVKWSPAFVNISFVGANALAAELGADGAGVVVTQVVPFPADTSLPLVKRYQAALKDTDAQAQPGFVSLEGYMVGRLVVEALKKAGAEPTRKGFLDAVFKTGKFDLDGVALNYGEGDGQGMDTVFLTVIQPDGTFKAVTSLAGLAR